MSVSRCATTLAIDRLKKGQAYESGGRIVELVKKDIKPRDIMTKKAFENAIMVDMAMGGSTNTVLHTLALANEAGIDYLLTRINAVAEKVPYICKVSHARINSETIRLVVDPAKRILLHSVISNYPCWDMVRR